MHVRDYTFAQRGRNAVKTLPIVWQRLVVSTDESECRTVKVGDSVFGHPGLFVADGSLYPRSPGIAPSMTIAALAERQASVMT